MNTFFLSLFLFSFFQPLQEEPKFQSQVIDDNVAIGYGLAIGDVDGDRKPDILLADKKQFVWYRNGDWKRFVMVDNLTPSDNVCIAARDIDGDGKVEVAVGAQWNPGETSDSAKSGSVHFLIRPRDPTQSWTPVKLYHEPTIHRMRWVKTEGNKFQLIVLPLHGVGNKNGEGEPVNVLAYEIPKDPMMPWKHWSIDHSMHLTHNFDVVPDGKRELLYVGGKEGIKVLAFDKGKWSAHVNRRMVCSGRKFWRSQGWTAVRKFRSRNSTYARKPTRPLFGKKEHRETRNDYCSKPGTCPCICRLACNRPRSNCSRLA